MTVALIWLLIGLVAWLIADPEKVGLLLGTFVAGAALVLLWPIWVGGRIGQWLHAQYLARG